MNYISDPLQVEISKKKSLATDLGDAVIRKIGASSWDELSDKPFETLSDDFIVDDGELSVDFSDIEGMIDTLDVFKADKVNTYTKAETEDAITARGYTTEARVDAIIFSKGYAEKTWVEEKLAQKPCIEKLDSYLYKVTYPTIESNEPVSFSYGACSSFVRNGKLYRNFDWDYSEDLSFIVNTPAFTGMAFGKLDDISSLPYKVVDGVNKHGIKVSTHILFNDWEWDGDGDIPLYKIPYLVLTTMEKIEDIVNLPLNNLKNIPTLEEVGYLAQYLVTDGNTTYAILPSTDDNDYVAVDIDSCPKLTNFRWIESETVVRTALQNRPTGVERWNSIDEDTTLEDLRFTKAYETPDRLSEYIGMRGTTKDSPDSELLSIYQDAHTEYLQRQRDGKTWQTMHSVVYGDTMEHLWIQEDWTKDFMQSGVSKEYVDSEIERVEGEIPSIEGLATEEYVNSEIERVEGEIPSLDGYATETWVEGKGYQNESQVQQIVDNHHDSTKYDASNPSGFQTASQVATTVNAHHDSTKQDTISDLATIRSGAALGATAVQPAAIADMATKTYVDNHHDSTKQDAISDLATIRSGAALGATAVQPASISDMATKTWVEGKGYATEDYVDEDIDDLQAQIDALVSKSDVVDVVADYQELEDYDTSKLGENDVVKVLDDETHQHARTYYRWVEGSWSYIGSESVGYTKSETDTLLNAKQDTISDLTTIRSGAALGATAVQPAAISDMASKTWVGQQGYITSSYHDSTKQDLITSSNKLNYNLLSNTPDIPDSTSDLINDSGFIANADIILALSQVISQNPVKVQLNDAQYAVLQNTQNNFITIDATALGIGKTVFNKSISENGQNYVLLAQECVYDESTKELISGRLDSVIVKMADKIGTYTTKGIANADDIPTALSELSSDETHRLVTDTEKTGWDAKSVVSVSSSGTSTDKVNYITIDGVEKKIGGDDLVYATNNDIDELFQDKLRIGGRIFYDDGDNGATYTFYDASGNVIPYSGSNPETALANAVTYEVSGTPTKDRFYVFNNELQTSVQWGKYGTKIGSSGVPPYKTNTIGSGKLNTNACLDITGWETDSIFQYIIDCNSNELGGCTDWYIGSEAEQDKLKAVESIVGIDWYSGIRIWSSVEYSSDKAYVWSYATQSWGLNDKSSTNYKCFAQRSF